MGLGLIPVVKKIGWPIYLSYKILRRSEFFLPIVFVFMVVPDLLGTHAFLVSQGLNQLIAVFATVGVQFGGQAIELWNSAVLFPEASLVEKGVLIVGSIWALLRVLWFYYIFDWIADNLEPTVGNVSKWMVASLVLAMSTGIAWLVDTYALQGQPRLTGTSYVIQNPELVVDPLMEFLGSSGAESVEALNNSVNNSSVGG